MKLKKYLPIFLEQKERTKSTHQQYKTTVQRLKNCIGRQPKLKDFSDQFINEHISLLAESGFSPSTVHCSRGLLLAIWRAAYDDGLLKVQPRKVRTVFVPPPVVSVWTPDEMNRLFESAGKIKGTTRKIPYARSLMAQALIALAWDTGLRRSDLHLMRMDTVAGSTTFTIVQKKSKSRVVCRIHESTQELFRRIGDTPCGYALPRWANGSTRLHVLACRSMEIAGLKAPHNKVLHMIRRSSITNVESQEAGAGSIHGGHANSSVTRRHYIADEIAFANKPLPASLVG